MFARIILAGLVALGACSSTKPPPAQSPSAQDAADPKAPVARINGETITRGELDDLVRKDQRRLDSEYQERSHQLKQQGLDSIIAKRLVEAKAKKEGIAPEALVKREVFDKVPEPSAEEIRAVYEKAKASGQQLGPLDQVRGDIARYLQRQKSQEELAHYYDRLRAEAKVENLLPPYRPPRVEVAATGPARGPEKALVTIVEFSDFQCPYCGRAESTVNQLLAEYKDKVRLVYRDFPLPFHGNAEKAAEAAHCAGDQGKYWEMHGKLFANQNSLELGQLKSYAHDLSLDQTKFDKCLDSGEKAQLVEANKKAGDEAGVSGTPAFFVNGMMISGAQPYESFKSLVDAELAAK